MPLNSRNKGKNGELEAARKLAEVFGCEASRGQQRSGGPDSPDVRTSIQGVHFEVKRTEKLQLYSALDQAIADAGDSVPVVLHRKSRCDWVAIVRLEDLPALVQLLTQD